MQKEWKVLTAFRWQSDGWAGRLEGKCSRGLLSGHTRAPFNKVQRWAAPQHIAREWGEGECEWKEGRVSCIFPEPHYLSCQQAWDSSHVHRSRDWKSSVRTGAEEDSEIWRCTCLYMLILDMPVTLWHYHLYMKEYRSPNICTYFFNYKSVMSEVIIHVVIQPITLMVLTCNLIWTMSEDEQK